MLSLAKNTNNIVLTNPITFNLPTLNNLIKKTSAANIERIFNTNPILKNIGLTHIKSWLTKVWYPILPKIYLFHIVTKQKILHLFFTFHN